MSVTLHRVRGSGRRLAMLNLGPLLAITGLLLGMLAPAALAQPTMSAAGPVNVSATLTATTGSNLFFGAGSNPVGSGLNPGPTYLVAAAASAAIGEFQPDTGTLPNWLSISGSTSHTATLSTAVNMTSVAPLGVPAAVMSNQRWTGTSGNATPPTASSSFSYAFSGLTANQSYNIVLLWSDNVTSRAFDVLINGSQVATNFNVGSTFGKYVATYQVYSATGTGSGATVTITVTLNNGSGNSAMINALMVYPATTPMYAVAAASSVAVGFFQPDEGVNKPSWLTLTANNSSTTTLGTAVSVGPGGLAAFGAPPALFDNQRWTTTSGGSGVTNTNSFSYAFTGLTANQTYNVVLLWADNVGSGSRQMNVYLNGNQVLSNFDVGTVTGGTYIAAYQVFSATGTGSGATVTMTVSFANGSSNSAMVNGLMVYPATTPIYAVAAASSVAVGVFQPDEGASMPSWLTLTANNSSTTTLGGTVNASNVAGYGAAPSLFDNQRWTTTSGGSGVTNTNSFSYAFTGLTANQTYNVVLFWGDNSTTRAFNVFINGTAASNQVLSNFNVGGTYGTYVATSRSFSATGTGSGATVTITVIFANGSGSSAMVNGILIYPGTPSFVVPAITTGGGVVPVLSFASTPGGGGTLYYTYQPVITAVSATEVPLSPTFTVTITGNGFTGTTQVMFGSATATLVSVSETSLTVFPPSASAAGVSAGGVVNISVTAQGTTATAAATSTSAAPFTYLGPPTLVSLTPAAGPVTGATAVNFIGSNLTLGSVTFAGVPAASLGTPAYAVAVGASATIGFFQPDTGTLPGWLSLSGSTSHTTTLATAVNMTNVAAFGIPMAVLQNQRWTGTTSGTGVTATDSFTYTFSTLTPNQTYNVMLLWSDNVTNRSFDVLNAVGSTATIAYTYQPVITSVSATYVPLSPTATITLTGNGFTGTTLVTFGSAAVAPTSTTETTITVVPPSASAAGVAAGGTVNISVTARGTTATAPATSTSAATLSYLAPPTLAGITPAAGPVTGGSTVNYTGTNLILGNISIAGMPAAVATQTYAVAVAASATIGIFQPDTGTLPSWLSLSGSTSHTTTLATAVNMTNVAAFNVPMAALQSQRWTGTTSGTGVTATDSFTYTFSALTPNQSYNVVLFWSDNVTNRSFDVILNGNPVLTNFNVGSTYGTYVATYRSFSAAAASNGTITLTLDNGSGNSAMVNAILVYPSASATSTTFAPAAISPAITTGGGVYSFLATNAVGGTATLAYTYQPVVASVTASLSGLTPTTTVTIAGNGFTGTTQVAFGSATATPTSVTETLITVVPPSASAAGVAAGGTVSVSVTAQGTAASAPATSTMNGSFTYMPTPTVAGVTPNTGAIGSTATVTITGSNFIVNGMNVSAVMFGSAACGTFTVATATSITAVPPATLSSGMVNVVVAIAGLPSSPISGADEYTAYQVYPYTWWTWSGGITMSTSSGATITWNSQTVNVGAISLNNRFYSWYAPATQYALNPGSGQPYGIAWGTSWATNLAAPGGMNGPFAAQNVPSGNGGSIASGDWMDFAASMTGGQISYYGTYSNANAWENPVFWSYYNDAIGASQTYTVTVTTTTYTPNNGYQYYITTDGNTSSPLGITHYVGNSGMWYFNNDASNPGNKRFANGPFYQDSRTRTLDITDGTSNTILFGESLGGPDNAAPTYLTTWMGSGTMPSYWDCQSPSQYFMFSSRHPGVVNFMFCDGSVRPITRVPAAPHDTFDTPPAASASGGTARWVAFQYLAGINDGVTADTSPLGLTE